jgi:hypothetical protein
MQVTIYIPEDLAAQAEAEGLAPQAYVERLVEQVGVTGVRKVPKRSPEETQAWLDRLARFSEKIPPMAGRTFSRGIMGEPWSQRHPA